MISCILVLYIAISDGPWAAPAARGFSPADPAQLKLRATDDPVAPRFSPADPAQLKLRATGDPAAPRFSPAVARTTPGATSIETPAPGPLQTDDPDALYARRDDLASGRAAERIWSDRLAKQPNEFESAWKLARARYWLGGHAPERERKKFLEEGIAAGRTAIALMPSRPEGHFWVAANMGALAESYGLRQGLKYRGEIKSELETVLKLDPAFQEGSADRALGRWYEKVPGLFGGSDRKSEEHLRAALAYNPNSTATLYFLAETLIDEKKKDEAKAMLTRVIAAPLDPAWAPEDRDFKAKAQRLLCQLENTAC